MRDPGPVVIGGLGGSGSRVVAQLLKEIGYDMGIYLNEHNDNLWFTLLLKRPKWYKKVAKKNKKYIFKAFNILEKAMTGGFKPSLNEFDFIIKAAMEKKTRLHHAHSLLFAKKDEDSSHIGWGWKEPNSHIYLPYLNKYFPHLKYIHVIRHGLDMAHSSNRGQLYHWADLYNIKIPDSTRSLPRTALHYWIKANKKTIDYGKNHLNDRFLVLRYDELCSDTHQEVNRLIRFLQVDRKKIDTNHLCQLIQPPRSIGRYKKYDVSQFNKEEINAVQKLGFKVD